MKKKKEERFPINFTKAEVYYIYPFVLDFQALQVPGKPPVLDQWLKGGVRLKLEILRSEFPLKRGLPDSRLGYPPLLPYKALVKEWGYHQWNNNEISLPRVDRPRGTKNITVGEKVFTIRECGNGVLTYKFSTNNLKELIKIFRRIPRLGYDCKPKPEVSLFHNVRKELKKLEKLLQDAFGVKNDIWEDRSVIFVEDGNDECPEVLKRPFVLPFSITFLYLPEEQYAEFDRFLSELLEEECLLRKANGSPVNPYPSSPTFSSKMALEDQQKWIQGLMALTAQYWRLEEAYKLIFPSKKEFIKLWESPATFGYMGYFLNNISLLVVLPQQEGKDLDVDKDPRSYFIQTYTQKTIVASVEMTVMMYHFATILDALLDELLLKLCRTEKLSEIAKKRKQFYELALQAAFFLEDVSQYVRSGFVGADMSSALRNVFRGQEIERRLQRKLDMTERVLLGKQLTIDEALACLQDEERRGRSR